MKRITRILLFILGIIIGLLVLYHLYLSFLPEIKLLIHFDPHNEKILVEMVRSHGLEDLIFLFALNTIAVAIPGLSNGISSVLNGILYGPTLGFIVNWISGILGQVILLFGLQKLYNPKRFEHSKIYKLIMDQKYHQLGLTVGYMLPFIPSATVAYINDLVNKPFKKRIIPITIGVIPMAFLYAYGGDSILHFNLKRIFASVAGFLVIAIIAVLALIVLHKIKKHVKKI
ncbi:MAG: TVP38/TMEM64 family protein [Lactobacillus sp.]|nr:TVP38/TMEM64 family protein [Lactobacillus sp.]